MNKENIDLKKPRKRRLRRKSSKKVQFEEENQMSQEEISNMIDNIASVLGK